MITHVTRGDGDWLYCVRVASDAESPAERLDLHLAAMLFDRVPDHGETIVVETHEFRKPVCWIARDPNGRLYRFSSKPVWSEDEDQWELRREGDDLTELFGWPENAAPYPGHCLPVVVNDD